MVQFAELLYQEKKDTDKNLGGGTSMYLEHANNDGDGDSTVKVNLQVNFQFAQSNQRYRKRGTEAPRLFSNAANQFLETDTQCDRCCAAISIIAMFNIGPGAASQAFAQTNCPRFGFGAVCIFIRP